MKGHIIIIGILAVVIISLITLNVSFHRSLQMEMAEQFNKQQLLLARAESSGIKAYIDKIKNEMLRVSRFESMTQIKRETLHAFSSDGFFEDAGNVKMGITFLGSDGQVLSSHGNPVIEGPFHKYLIEMAKGVCPGEALIKQDPKTVNIATPACRSGSFIGIVVISLDIQDLAREFLGPIKSGSRGYAWMMDSKGDLLYHPTQSSMIGRNLYKTDTSCFKCHKSFDLEKKILEGKGDNYGKYVAPTGEDKVLAFSTVSIGDSKWVVAVSAPYSEVTASIQRSMKFHSWIIIFIFLITSAVSAVLIVLNRKRVRAEEGAKHRKELEKYAEGLEQKVDIRTKELTMEKEKLNTVISAIGSGIMLIDNHRKIQWVNQRMKDIVGQDITGMLCTDFFADCTINVSYKEHDIQTDVLSNLFGQRDKYFQVTTAPVKGLDKGMDGFIRLVHDVTEMKRMEEQMLHTEKLALLERLTASIAHEIGNPLTSVFSFVQMLKQMERDEFKKESLDTIQLNMNRIADIIKQLSGFSMMPPVELKSWKVNSLIEASLSLIQYDTRVNDITIVRDLPPLQEITTDGNQLSQVFVNLIMNAADAMPDGGTLTIRSRVKDKNIVLTFEDTGAGISGEDLSRIFDPFYTTKEKGTGLGLSVSKNIIEKLNGSIAAESEINKGSRFTITLPTALVSQT
ncbi:MAG: Cache 3/Cache 2 fusion domain-containing protein [Nitrospirae bacterium]|nr:Cache 3/Cache 2 fusion domain-containing protein [Nitrospirota bacterium]